MKEKLKSLQSSGETRKTNRPWHFLSTLNSLLLSKLLLLLIIPVMGTISAFGATAIMDFAGGTGPTTIDKVGNFYTSNGVSISTGSTRSLDASSSTNINGINFTGRNGNKTTYNIYMAGSGTISKIVAYFYVTNKEATATLTRKDNTTITPTYTKGAVGAKDKADSIVVEGSFSQGVMYTLTMSTNEKLYGAKIYYTSGEPEKYAVTYNGNGSTGGSVPTDSYSPYASDATVTVLGNTGSLEKTGYTWSCWNTANNGGGTDYSVGNTFTMGTSPVTLYAKWTANNYSVRFNKNAVDATGSMSNQGFTYGVAQALTANSFTRSGYTFAGWNTAADGSGMDYTNEQNVSNLSSTNGATVDLYAQWEAVGSVKFHFVKTSTNSGTYSPSEDLKSITTSDAASVLTGGTMAIYNNKADTNDTYSSSGITVNSNNDYLKITLTSGTFAVGDVITVDASQELCFTNNGAYSDANKTSSKTYTITSLDGLAGNSTIYVHRGAAKGTTIREITITGSAATKYTVTYDANGGTGTVPTDANEYPSGSSVTVLGNTGSLTKTNNTFAGWNTSNAADATNETEYAAGSTFSISANTTLFAVYKHLVTIGVNDEAMGTASAKYAEADDYYDKAENDAFVSGSFVSDGVHLVLNAYPNDGYEFDATYDENHPWGRGTGNDDETGGTAQVGNNNDYIAHFKAKTYAITLDKNGGNTSGSVTATYNSSALADYSAATRAGYVLTGYYTETSGGDKVIDAEGNLVANVSNYTDGNAKWIKTDVATPTLYAHWTAVFTVTFNANGGTCATESLTQATSGASIILPVATKDGASFSGWYDASSSGTRIGGAGDSYEPEANIILYAQFATSSTKFSMVRVGSTDAELASDAEYTLTGSEATITGANATGVVVKNIHSDPKQYLSKSNSGCFLFSTNLLYYEINLATALAQGDVISFTGYGSKELCFTTSATYDNTISSSEYTYTIPAGSALIGATKFYVWRTSPSSTYFNNLNITTASSALTYDVSFETNGIADEIEGLTEVTNLPDPLPTPENVADGYTFEGWYTNSTFTTRATAGATLGANTTLYANYIIDTPTITPASGAVYAGSGLTLTGSVPFTKVYAQWNGSGDALDKATAIAGDPTWSGEATDTYNFTCPDSDTGTRYVTFMVSDGTFYSRPAVTSAYTVSHLITIGTQPKGATYILDASATALSVTATVTGSGTLSYLWESSGDGETWNNASGTNNTASYSPSTATTGTTYYRCTVSSNNGAASVTSNVVTVTVNAAAAFTVSFNTGVGSNVDIDDISGTSITLPSVTKKSDDYEFVGWYDGDTKVGIAGGSYTPTGNITLTAKYNCKVTFDKSGDGSVSAVNASTGASISSPSKVFEGTEITFTATPTSVNEFESWSGDASGNTNPITIEVSDVTNVTANFSVSEDKELFHTTFITDDGWASGSEDVLSGSTGNVVEKTINGTKVTFAGKSGTSYTLNVNSSTHKLKFGGSNLNASAGSSTPNCYMAIHLTGVNGSITVDFGSSSQKWIYALDDGSTGTITTGKTQLGSAVSSFTIDNLKNDKVTLYLGQKGVTISELTITTPMTKLIADPTEVNFIGTASTADVKITTNSPGTVTATSNNTSVATVSYNSSTKKVTVTPGAKGETTITVQVAKSGAYPAKEIEIPVTVADPEIIVSTQPSNLACYQNEQTDKTFSVVASANTGAELSYQWYTCNSSGDVITEIAGAIESTYTLNTNQKKTVGTTYYKCKITTVDSSCPVKYTNVASVTVSALAAGGTYNGTVYVAAPGHTMTYTGMTGWTVKSGDNTDYFTAAIAGDNLTITGKSTAGSGTVVLEKDGSADITINVTVKKHVIKLIWSAEKKQYTVAELSAKGIGTNSTFTVDDGSHPENLPYLTRLYEDGTEYTGVIQYYSDDVTIAYFGDSGSGDDTWTKPSGESTKPTIRYGGGQGGCVFYAYVPNDNANGVEAVKATYDLRIINGYSNDLPSGRKVSVQQQYTLYIPNTDTKLVTVTYGGYKYNNAKWSKGTDSWGTATNYVGKENVIDGYAYAVRNKDNDAADEYEHAIQVEDDFGSAWYDPSDEGNPGGVSAKYQRIKPFRLPCRASYITFTAHKSGTLTAYVYQNGIIGRGGSENLLASAPRLGYWFDQEGWVQNPSAAVVSKQKIANNNARDKRIYDGKNNNQQMEAYWTNPDDEIMITKLRSHWCSVQHPDKDTPASAFSDTEDDTYKYHNPYYWGTYDEISANNAQVVPTPETPVPHEGGHLIVNEGYVKYTIDVVAGKTYYFFGKMTKVGYAGMNFVPAASENREDELTLNTTDTWSNDLFGTTEHDVIYNVVTLPSNYRIGKWNTICLPFAVNENQVEQVFGKGTELAIFNGLRHDTENHVYYIKYLRHVDQNILPGQPYLIYPTGKAVEERSNQDNGGMKETGEPVPTVNVSGEDYVIGTGSSSDVRLTFHNVIINKGITAQSYGCDVDADGTTTSYVFKGTDARTDIVKYDLYNAPKTGALNRYMPNPATKTMKLNTYHAFIQASDSKIQQDAITFAFSEDDIEKAWDPTTWRDEDDVDPGEATGIVIIEDVVDGGQYGNTGRATNGKYYNMMGQQVDPTSAKGIILINGKKVMY